MVQLEVKIKGYNKTVNYNILPNGNIEIKESFKYISDENTEILGKSELRDLTIEELNEVMEEIELGPIVLKDRKPLKNIRTAVANT